MNRAERADCADAGIIVSVVWFVVAMWPVLVVLGVLIVASVC